MLMMAIWPSCIKTIGGYLDFIMTIKEYLIVIAAGLICYIITNILSYRHIKNIPMTIGLKIDNGSLYQILFGGGDSRQVQHSAVRAGYCIGK